MNALHRPPGHGPLRNGNYRGNPNPAPRCGANTRTGCPCKGPAMPNGRCRMHGGATPRHTPEARDRIAAARSTQGGRSKAARAMLARNGHCVRQARLLLTTSRLGTEATAGSSSEELSFVARTFWQNILSVPRERLLLAVVRENGARAKPLFCAQTPIRPETVASAQGPRGRKQVAAGPRFYALDRRLRPSRYNRDWARRFRLWRRRVHSDCDCRMGGERSMGLRHILIPWTLFRSSETTVR